MRSLKNLYALAATGAAGLSLVATAAPVRAATIDGTTSSLNIGGSIGGTGNFSDQFAATASTVLNIILLVAGVVAVFYLVWSGFQYITAGGSPDKAKAARTGIINAVIGIVIIVAAYLIINFAIGLGNQVSNTTGS